MALLSSLKDPLRAEVKGLLAVDLGEEALQEPSLTEGASVVAQESPCLAGWRLPLPPISCSESTSPPPRHC